MREEDKMYREGIQEMKQEALKNNQVRVIWKEFNVTEVHKQKQ